MDGEDLLFPVKVYQYADRRNKPPTPKKVEIIEIDKAEQSQNMKPKEIWVSAFNVLTLLTPTLAILWTRRGRSRKTPQIKLLSYLLCLLCTLVCLSRLSFSATTFFIGLLISSGPTKTQTKILGPPPPLQYVAHTKWGTYTKYKYIQKEYWVVRSGFGLRGWKGFYPKHIPYEIEGQFISPRPHTALIWGLWCY